MTTDVQQQSHSFDIFRPERQPLLVSNVLGNVFDTNSPTKRNTRVKQSLLRDVPRPVVPLHESGLNFPPNAALVLTGPSPQSRMRSRLGMQSQASFFIRHNPHPIRVRHIEGLNGAPVCAVHDHDYLMLPRISMSTSPNRDYIYGYQNARSNFQNYPFKEKAVPRIGLIPITSNWRGELRELCEKAGLVTDDLPPQPCPPTPPRSPSGRKSVYSDTGRLIPPPSRATSRPPSRAISRQSTRYSGTQKEQYSHITPYPDTESLMLEMLCQILQTDSIQAIQQWLVSAGDREKTLVLDLIRTAMSSEEVLLENPHEEERILPPSPPQSRARTARSEERKMQEEIYRETPSRQQRVRRTSVSAQSHRSTTSRGRKGKPSSSRTPKIQGTLRLQKGSPTPRRLGILPEIEENSQPVDGVKDHEQ